MVPVRNALLCIVTLLCLLPIFATATKYTRFEDLPKCGRKCLPESLEYSLKKADCGTSLYCACTSASYSEHMADCLHKNDPCDKDPTRHDVLEYNQDYYCNATSEQPAQYTVKVDGVAKTLTVEDDGTVSSTSSIMSSTTSTSTKVRVVTTSTSSTGNPPTSDGKSTSMSHGSLSNATVIASSTSLHSSSAGTTAKSSTSTTSTSTSSPEPTTSSSVSISQTGSIPPGMIVVDANTTIMGHTVTVKATTLVTATVSSGTGPCQFESLRRRLVDYVDVLIGFGIASLAGLVLFIVG